MMSMFLTNGMYLSFCFNMSCLRLSMDIFGVGSFPVQHGGSLIIFQHFKYKNLALNRDIFPSFRGRHVGGCQA